MLNKAIIEVQNGASRHTRAGWKNVLESIGYNVTYYDIESGIPVNDIFDKLGDIKLFLGTTYNLNRPLIRQILKRPEMKIALYCSGFGDLVKEINLQEYPIQVASTEELANFDYIKKQVGCVHIHIQDNLVEPYIGNWNKRFGVPTIGVMNAADTFVYCQGSLKEKYAADIGWVGGNWKYKARNIDKTLVRLCRERWTDFNIKVFGSGFDVPQALGNIGMGEDAHVFASAKICPNISEPHTTDTRINDLVERNFKVPAAGGFLITDAKLPQELAPYVPVFYNYEGFVDVIEHYLKNNEERLILASRQKEIVLKYHTYFDRMHKLLDTIGLYDDARACLESKSRHILIP